MAFARQTYRPAVLVFGLLWFIWGYNWVVMKRALQFAGPIDFAMLRIFFGTVTLFAALVVMRKPLRPQAVWPTVLLGLLQTSGLLVLSNFALMVGGAGKVSVLCFTMPFWTLLLAWVFLGERIRGWQWLAVALGLAGLLLILEPWKLQATLLSEVFAVGAGICWASSAIMVKWMRARHDLELLSLTAWQMLFGLIPIAILAWMVPSRPIQWSGYFLFSLVFAGMLSTGIGWVMWLYVLNRLPAGTAGLNALAIPVVAVLLAWLELGERPGMYELLGMLTIGVALALVTFLAMPRRIQVSPAIAQR